ncbi:hypothetical protein Tco_0418999 [Tanacetum coccineum]
MVSLDFCSKHNMVAYLEKTDGNIEFHQIMDFLIRSLIYYALTISPIVSTSFVEQFWTTAKSRTINNISYIDATVAGKPVTISEASIRSDLLFDDADGIDSLNNQAIFDNIQLMGLLFVVFENAEKGEGFLGVALHTTTINGHQFNMLKGYKNLVQASPLRGGIEGRKNGALCLGLGECGCVSLLLTLSSQFKMLASPGTLKVPG